MALEDLFTSSELKYGLTSPDRVKEVIESMENEKDCVIKNVAKVIAITESNECLDLFVQSNGLEFIDKWLNEVQKLENIFFEESAIALLKAIDKLQINNRELVASIIGTSVENLTGHDNSVVCEKAKELRGKLMQLHETEPPCEDKISKDDEDKKTEEALVLSTDDNNVVETDVKEDEDVVGSSVAGALQDSPVPQPQSTERPTTPKESEPIGESAKESEKVFPAFDLNEELCSEETENIPVDSSSNPISVVPLRFEGRLGWKGSAATSAFRRISESSVSGNSKGCNNLDLNASGGEESSVDASPRRSSARLHLDLNSIGDERQSPCQSSSSSSMQPCMRNVDLNMNQQSFISLFGTQVLVNNHDNNVVPQAPPGWGVGSSMGAYGYNNSTMFFPSPYAYMVDPRVVPVGPQFVGPNFAQQPPFLTMNHPGFNGNNEGSFVNGQRVSGNGNQSSSSVVGEKREEPESGWDAFPGNCKH